MFKTIRRIINWCGEFKGKLYIGFVFSFFSNIFAAMPIMVAAYTVGMLIFFRFLFDYLRAKFQEAISYELIARDRLAIGDALKRVSLGYFQQMNTGNILSSITTGLGTLETMGIRMIDNFVGGYLNFICIAHRLSTIEQADQILVVADGQIAECGTHEELIRKEGKYQQFVKIRKKAEGWKLS